MFQTLKPRFQPTPRSHSKTIKAALLFGATTVALAAFAAVVITTKRPPTDKQHCLVGAVPERSHYVLIDLTDSLTSAQLHRVRSEVLRASAALQDADRLEIVVLAAQKPRGPAVPSTVFAGCRPRSADGPGFDRGRRVLERDLREGWTQPIQAGLDSIEQRMGVPAATSPLLATVKEIATRAVGRNRSFDFIGDLIESEVVNGYTAAQLDFKTLQQARFDAAQVTGLLKGFNDVHVFERIDPKHPQQQAQALKLWASFFESAGAGNVVFSRF